MSAPRRVLIYVPGLRPKPEPEAHHALLRRCLLEGVRRADPAVAASLAEAADWLRLVSWGHLLYPEYRDLEPDAAGIAALLERSETVPADVAPVLGWRWGVRKLLYRIGNRWPALAHLLADSRARLHLADSFRYFSGQDGAGTRIRAALGAALAEAQGASILLMAHSFGSVIAWDTLWELGHKHGRPAAVDLLLTMGSPLGSPLVRRRLAGAREAGARRYPPGIRRWRNLAALGELTTVGRRFADDFASMRTLGLVEEISDRTDLINPFHGASGLNVHRCYGYFVNRTTGAILADWWRAS